ncbi:hypothetical protein K440DRAFT_381748 [Wilcoxina mikolae CBS 423.85]|nr:hypothetical protein K440DRAFT_381748 [Wilcoxina mikolae CBS 423.85]
MTPAHGSLSRFGLGFLHGHLNLSLVEIQVGVRTGYVQLSCGRLPSQAAFTRNDEEMQPTFQGFPRRHDERRFRTATSVAGGRQPRPQCCMLSGSLILSGSRSQRAKQFYRLQVGVFKRFCFFSFFILHHCSGYQEEASPVATCSLLTPFWIPTS